VKSPTIPPLQAIRKARGLGLRETARRAQINPGHLSRVERGEKQLSLAALHRLAVVLGLAEFAEMLRLYLPGEES
jgi:transcriptional regulator with XRE-family HTH domain